MALLIMKNSINIIANIRLKVMDTEWFGSKKQAS